MENKSKIVNELQGKKAILKKDFYTDDECTFGIIIKKDTIVYIKSNESDGICYVDDDDFVFAISYKYLKILN